MKNFKIVDFDLVSVSSLNRHAFAFRNDVGAPKVLATKNHLNRICPDIKCEIVDEFLTKENCARILGDKPCFVADCIDDMETKAALLIHCIKNNIHVISSGGAGMKMDPS